MITEQRKTKRVNDYLPIEVSARHGSTGKTMAGPFSSRIINISATGACLLISQVMSDRYHIFYSTREDDSLILELTINLPPDIFDFKIPARPVWMNLYRQEEIRAFKMGVEFLTNREGRRINKLMEAMSEQQEKRASWWTSHSLR